MVLSIFPAPCYTHLETYSPGTGGDHRQLQGVQGSIRASKESDTHLPQCAPLGPITGNLINYGNLWIPLTTTDRLFG